MDLHHTLVCWLGPCLKPSFTVCSESTASLIVLVCLYSDQIKIPKLQAVLIDLCQAFGKRRRAYKFFAETFLNLDCACVS